MVSFTVYLHTYANALKETMQTNMPRVYAITHELFAISSLRPGLVVHESLRVDMPIARRRGVCIFSKETFMRIIELMLTTGKGGVVNDGS